MSDFQHLDTMQGASDARIELYLRVRRRSTVASNAAVLQEFWQSFELCSKARQNGGEV